MANELVPAQREITAQQAFPFEPEIMNWKYEKEVDDMKNIVSEHRNVGQKLAKRLFIAHAALARIGGDRRSEDAPVYTWTGFLENIGLSRKMAMLYMTLYDPVNDRVRDPEEVRIERKQKESVTDYSESRVCYAMETETRPDGWTVYDEQEYKIRASNRRFTEMANKWLKERIRTNYKDQRDYFGEVLSNTKQYAKVFLKTKEQALAQMEVFEHMTDFLSMIEEPEVRLAAAFNTGLRIRQIINELAESEAELAKYDISGELGE